MAVEPETQQAAAEQLRKIAELIAKSGGRTAAVERQSAWVRKIAELVAKSGSIGAAPAPHFGTTGFLDPTLEYFVRNELEKLETRLNAKIDKTEGGLKEHLEKELRKMADSFGDRINKALMWGIGAALVLVGIALTIAHYWVIPGSGK